MTVAPRPGYTKDGIDTGHVNAQGIVSYVRAYWLEHGYCPTVEEILVALQISSKSVVNYHVKRLVKQGYLTQDTGQRTLRPGDWREHLKEA